LISETDATADVDETTEPAASQSTPQIQTAHNEIQSVIQETYTISTVSEAALTEATLR
jgi:hypothetical protein